MWITLIAIVVVLALLSTTKFEVRHEIEINASAEKVWQTVIDFKNHHHWNTQLAYLGGDVKPHGKLHLKLAVEGATPYEFTPTVSQWHEYKVFGWLAITGIPRLFDGEHFFEIISLDAEKTKVVNREEYRGVLSLFMKQLPMMKLAPKGFEKMDHELKVYLEKSQ